MGETLQPLSEHAALLTQVIGTSTDLIYLKDRQGRYITCNKAYASLYDRTPEDLIGRDVDVFDDAEFAKIVRAKDQKFFDDAVATHYSAPRLDPEGRQLWLDVVKTPLFDSNGELSGFACIARDVTHQHNIECRLENQNAWLEHLNLATVSMIRSPEDPVDMDSLIRSMSKLTMSSYSVIYVEPGPNQDRSATELFIRAEVGESTVSSKRLFKLAKDAQRSRTPESLPSKHIHAIPLNSEDTRNGVLISEWSEKPTDETLALTWTVARQLGVLLLNKNLVDETKYRATHDDLTGLANRRQLTFELDQALAQREIDDIPVAVIFGDLDGFKQVNDTWGHHRGDLLLQLVSERLRNTVRATDTLARLGGDEFAFVLCNGDRAICAGFLDRITNAVEEPFDIGVGEPVRVGLSVGFALTPDDGVSSSDLMIAADKAMYENKAKRRGEVKATSSES